MFVFVFFFYKIAPNSTYSKNHTLIRYKNCKFYTNYFLPWKFRAYSLTFKLGWANRRNISSFFLFLLLPLYPFNFPSFLVFEVGGLPTRKGWPWDEYTLYKIATCEPFSSLNTFKWLHLLYHVYVCFFVLFFPVFVFVCLFAFWA